MDKCLRVKKYEDKVKKIIGWGRNTISLNESITSVWTWGVGWKAWAYELIAKCWLLSAVLWVKFWQETEVAKTSHYKGRLGSNLIRIHPSENFYLAELIFNFILRINLLSFWHNYLHISKRHTFILSTAPVYLRACLQITPSEFHYL